MSATCDHGASYLAPQTRKARDRPGISARCYIGSGNCQTELRIHAALSLHLQNKNGQKDQDCIIYRVSLLALFRVKQGLCCRASAPPRAFDFKSEDTGAVSQGFGDPLVAPYLQFAAGFEDGAGCKPVVSSLLFHADVSSARYLSCGSHRRQTTWALTVSCRSTFWRRPQRTSDIQAQRRDVTAGDLQDFAFDETVARDAGLRPPGRKKAPPVDRPPRRAHGLASGRTTCRSILRVLAAR